MNHYPPGLDVIASYDQTPRGWMADMLPDERLKSQVIPAWGAMADPPGRTPRLARPGHPAHLGRWLDHALKVSP